MAQDDFIPVQSIVRFLMNAARVGKGGITHSLTGRPFGELFAMAQAAPGPNVRFAALLGQYIAGVPAYRMSQVFEAFPAGAPLHRRPGQRGASHDRAYRGKRAHHRARPTRGSGHLADTAVGVALVYWTRARPLLASAAAALLGPAGLV
jgi:hypothetical protein